MTADSKVSMVWSRFFGVNELLPSCSFCVILRLYSDNPKCALSLIRLVNVFRSLLNVASLYLGGRGQKFKFLPSKLKTCKENECLLMFITRPFGSSLNLSASRSFFVVLRKHLLCLLEVLVCPLPYLDGGLDSFLEMTLLFL